MDRDTLQDDLDLILGARADAQPVGEWDWEPPLGATVPRASSVTEPEEPDDAGTDPVEEDEQDD